MVGHASLQGVQFGDIWAHGRFAYLGTFSCGGGVRVFDISNPTDPRQVSTLRTSLVDSYEDVVVIRADTAFFRGDLLAVGLQECESNGANQVQFWDVSDPLRPAILGSFNTGIGTRGVHELYMFQRNSRVFALLAVPSSEGSRAGRGFRIVEATDPRNPRQIADWGADAGLGSQPTGRGRTSFCHSAWASADGTIAYLSYWDHGVIMLDISNPANPRFLGQTLYPEGEEGNAHSVWPVPGRDLLLVADEDFSTSGASLSITEPAAMAGRIAASEIPSTKRTCDSGGVSGEVVYVGKGCKTKHYPPDVQGNIALIDSDGCKTKKKLKRAQAAGASGAIIVVTGGVKVVTAGNNDLAGIPSVAVNQADGERIKEALASGTSLRVLLSGDPQMNSWGHLRIYDTSDMASPRQVGMFATERSQMCPPPAEGWYTIHNPFVVGNTAYLSWYGDGLRVIDISDPANPRETAFFVPGDTEAAHGQSITPQHNEPVEGGAAAVWGVYVHGDLILLSDISNGLYILRHKPEQ
jgi:hypothetical protein